jgi:cardiolipin synthase A/B
MMRFTSGNQLKLLRNGTEYFPALEHSINLAKHEVYLQTYIFQADSTGIRIGNALIKAAQRGVLVNVLIDGFGSKDLAKSYIDELRKNGVQIIIYRAKISPWTLQKNRLRRMHRKIAVIDGEIAYIGGINIIDDNNAPNQTPPRIDYAVVLEGPIVLAILESVRKLWRRLAWLTLKQSYISKIQLAVSVPSKIFDPGLNVAFVIRDNVLHRHDIEKAYLNAIAEARNEIIIANAYFVPSRKFRQALLTAASNGVNVKLLLQGRKEFLLMFATHAFYSEFLSAGIEIYEYRKSFMHSKVAVVDSYWATVGSSNIDPFSLLLANEANIVVYDSQFAKELKNDLTISINEAYHLTLGEWVHGSRLKRFFSWITYGIVRIFLGIIDSKDN